MSSSEPRVLVILLCETRGWELTAPQFRTNVVEALGADLALCVGNNERETHNPFYEMASHVWRLPEPDDWGTAFEAAAGNRDWETLLELDEQVLGGIDYPPAPQIGSGAIILFFRHFLRQCLEADDLISAYDWFVVTRSDFVWPRPHPRAALLNPRRIYLLDGEQYGGISDRHAVVPQRLMPKFLQIVEPIFTEPAAFRARLERAMVIDALTGVNPERLLATRMKELGLWRKIRYLPYVPFTVRAPGSHTRWQTGYYDEERGYYVKYRPELIRSQISERFIDDQRSWARYLAPVRGIVMRSQLRHAYTKAGVRDRFAPLAPMHRLRRRLSYDLGRGGARGSFAE